MTALSCAVKCCHVLSSAVKPCQKDGFLPFFPHFPFFHQSPKKIQELEEVFFVHRLFLWVSSSGFSFIFLLNPFFFSLSLYFFSSAFLLQVFPFFSFSSSEFLFLQLLFFRSFLFLQDSSFFFSFSLQGCPSGLFLQVFSFFFIPSLYFYPPILP